MCASNDLMMDTTQVRRRYSSRSSAATTIGSDDTLVSPLSSPSSWSDQLSGLEPLILTGPNNRQWIDLDILSPKLLQELRRRNDLPSAEANPKALSKGAAKIKAWARQGKRGIDVRLGRKLDGRPDEYTDLNIPPDVLALGDHKEAPIHYDLKLHSMPELPGNAVHEMPDTSRQELDSSDVAAVRSPSGGSTMSAYDTLSIYNGRSMTDLRPQNFSTQSEPQQAVSPDMAAVRSSSSHSSMLLTPTDIASILDEKLFAAIDRSKSPPARDQIERSATGTNDSSTSLQPLIGEPDAASSEEISHAEALGCTTETPSIASGTLEHHHGSTISSSSRTPTVVETANSCELTTPPTLCDRLQPQQRSAPASLDHVTTTGDTQASSHSGSGSGSPMVLSQSEYAHTDRSVDRIESSRHFGSPQGPTRRQTVPPKLPGTAGVEELWDALLEAQAMILGPEHPITYRTRYEFSQSRRQQHRASGSDVLQGLRLTEKSAQEELGLHPLVASFTSNFGLLKLAMSGTMSETFHISSDIEPASPASIGCPSAAGTTAQPPEAEAQIDDGQDKPETPPNASPLGRVEQPDEQATSESARQSPSELPPIVTSLTPSSSDPTSDPTPPPFESSPWANTWQAPHKLQNPLVIFSGIVFASMARSTSAALTWLLENHGPEPQVEPNKVRVRWTCSCGSQLYDDFVERRQGAGRELEAYLNRPRMRPHTGGSPTTPASSHGSRAPSGFSSGVPSSQTSWTSYGSASNQASPIDTRTSQRPSGQGHLPFHYPPDPPWLLTCANESRYTPKLAHLDMSSHKITSDRDLALALRKHYFRVNQKWYRTLKLRGLTTLEFVQFEVHQNRFTDIRKCPDMPPVAAKDYAFEPGELVPPVGPAYLLHLFKHPEDYDGELITYLRVPKKSGRLSLGVGWGIHLVEGFLPDRVWMLLSGLFALASLVFGILWAWKNNDVQGAFGVSAWICGLALLSVGWLQAGLG